MVCVPSSLIPSGVSAWTFLPDALALAFLAACLRSPPGKWFIINTTGPQRQIQDKFQIEACMLGLPELSAVESGRLKRLCVCTRAPAVTEEAAPEGRPPKFPGRKFRSWAGLAFPVISATASCCARLRLVSSTVRQKDVSSMESGASLHGMPPPPAMIPSMRVLSYNLARSSSAYTCDQ